MTFKEIKQAGIHCKDCPYVFLTSVQDPLSFTGEYKLVCYCHAVPEPFIVKADDTCHNCREDCNDKNCKACEGIDYHVPGKGAKYNLSTESLTLIGKIARNKTQYNSYVITDYIFEEIKFRLHELERRYNDLTNDHETESMDFYKKAYLDCCEKLDAIRDVISGKEDK